MTDPARDRKRRLISIDAALALMAIILIVQMWLLSATLEQFLRGRYRIAVPAALVAGLLFGACGALYLLVRRVDRR